MSDINPQILKRLNRNIFFIYKFAKPIIKFISYKSLTIYTGYYMILKVHLSSYF